MRAAAISQSCYLSSSSFPPTKSFYSVFLVSRRLWQSSRKSEQPFPAITADDLVLFLDEPERFLSSPSLKRLHSQILTRCLHSDPSVGIKLMRAYSACGDPASTRQIFDGVFNTKKNIIFFNVMIRSYVNNHLFADALLVFSNLMTAGTKPDNYTFPCVLKACSCSENLQAGVRIHSIIIKVGLDSNLFVGNGLISMYARCGCYTDAQLVFDGMPRKDVVSWNAIVAGYAQSGQSDRALEVCREMIESRNVKPDAGTMASISTAMANTELGNVQMIRRVFEEMPRKGLVSWNAMIAVYVNNSMASEAVELFSQMELHGVEPDAVTLASVLPAVGDLSGLVLGNQICDYIESKRMRPNIFLENALVDMYSKCGCLSSARDVFDIMHDRDVVSWTSMISAYGMHGHGQDAVSLFEKLLVSGLAPDHIAFLSILSACSHSGLLKEGRRYFNIMTGQYQLVPRIEHFGCMVDLLGRAGQIEEAYEFVKQMPVDPNERVWGALLSACRVYTNMNIGLVAADHLYKLAPEQSGYYVLLSNIYAKAGRWEDVASVRSVMRSKGIKKSPGCSNVEFGNRVHTFFVSDRSHPQSKEIYEKLEVLAGRLKEAGYAAETDSALHDVEEEDKECHLAVHSEKLAIAFALINTEPGTTIRVTKNLRVCGDCHSVAKLISNSTGRLIILRDVNRFHHFEGGVCSCDDYW